MKVLSQQLLLLTEPSVMLHPLIVWNVLPYQLPHEIPSLHLRRLLKLIYVS